MQSSGMRRAGHRGLFDDLAWVRNADGVADRHFECTHRDERLGELDHPRDGNGTFVRTTNAVDRYPRTRTPACCARAQTFW